MFNHFSEFPSYVKPACISHYYSSTFTGDDPYQFCSVIINGTPCGAPRWCHFVWINPEKRKGQDDFIDRYCKKSQKWLMNKYPNDYETTNGLCVLCLYSGICCRFIDHPEVDDKLYLESKVAQLSIEETNSKKRSHYNSNFYLDIEKVDCTIEGLFTNSISKLFSHTESLSTYQPSKTPTNDSKYTFTFNDFKLLEFNMDNFSLSFSGGSALLNELRRNCKTLFKKKITKKKTYGFDNESTIQFLVNYLLTDFCTLINDSSPNIIELKSEVKIGSRRPDFYIFKSISEKNKSLPLMIVEVKAPGRAPLECYGEHQMQIKDYMRLARKEYGTVDIFGVLTDFDSWIFFWFEESDSIVNPIDNIFTTTPKSIEFNPNSKIYNSQPIEIIHSDFTISFLTFLSHSLNVRKFSNKNVPVMTSNQLIEIIRNKEFNITTLSKELVDVEFIIENYDKYKLYNIVNNSTFYNLKFLKQGRDGLTYLMSYSSNILTNQFNLIIIKILLNLESPEQNDYKNKNEEFLNKKIINEIQGWDCFGVQIQDFQLNYNSNNFKSLILPFCFTLKKNEKIFDFNFSYFDNFTSAPNFNTSFIELLNNASLEWSKEDSAKIAMNQALEIMWDKGFNHKDLKWRHLGLMPQFKDESGSFNLILKPVLFDFSDIEKIDKINSKNFEEYKQEKLKLL